MKTDFSFEDTVVVLDAAVHQGQQDLALQICSHCYEFEASHAELMLYVLKTLVYYRQLTFL